VFAFLQQKHEDDFEPYHNEKKLDSKYKERVCDSLEKVLDDYYKAIAGILNDLEDDPEDNQMGYLVDMMCKNDDPLDPGIRDHASYTRFDYIEKVYNHAHKLAYTSMHPLTNELPVQTGGRGLL